MYDLKMVTNAERVALSLKRHGVDTIFGMSNPAAIVLACEKLGIRQIGYRSENAGSYMTSGYALATGKIPVITGQGGPAAVLLNAGFAESLKASHPVVAIIQEISLSKLEKNAFQEIDMEKIFLGTTKWVKRILSQERIEDYIDMAFNIAGSGRPGPAVLLCPNNIFEDKGLYPISKRSSNLGYYPLDRMISDPDKIDEAAKIIAGAENVFIYSGGGVKSSGAQAELRAIQNECSIPVATTPMGKGSVDEYHPLSMGTIGYVMGKRSWSQYLVPMVKRSDVIVLVGNRTNANGTDNWQLLPTNAKYIHIDIDPSEIGRNYESLRLVGDAKLTLSMLKESLLKQDLSKRHSKREAIEEEIAESRVKFEKTSSDVTLSNEVPLRIERFLSMLDKKLDYNHIVVGDASFASCWIMNYIRATGNRSFIFPRGLAGLSWGFPMAIGAKVGAPDRKVFVLCGDASFAYVWSELEMCKRYGINVVVAIINNSCFAYQKYWEIEAFNEYTTAMDLGCVDHVKIAEACGVKGIKVEMPENIESAIDEALNANTPVVIDIITNESCIAPIQSMESLEG
jgi:acetolactate synthase-1/2/3 large subunit